MRQEIPAGKFKTHCLKIMDEVQKSKRPVLITKHGKPVAKLVPIADTPAPLFGLMQDLVTIKGDIIGPIGEKWDADY
jgi:prevent-host-death family protein